jgi:hypothetical protein
MLHQLSSTLEHARSIVPPQQFDVTSTRPRQVLYRVRLSGDSPVEPAVAARRKQCTCELMQHGQSGDRGL